MEKSPKCIRCDGEVDTLGHAFFHCRTIVPLCNFVEGIMVHMLRRKSFGSEVSSVCNNVVPPMTRAERDVFLSFPRCYDIHDMDNTSKGILWGRDVHFFATDLVLYVSA